MPLRSAVVVATLATFAALAASLACERPRRTAAPPPLPSPIPAGARFADAAEASASSPVASAPPANPPTLDAPSFVPLSVPGFGDAVVSVPVGASAPRPVVVAAHGNYDRPEWQCEVWRGIVESRAFVLCPRGVARADSPSADDVRFTFASSESVAKEVDAGLVALRERFERFVDDGPLVYTGFSLGAITAVPYLPRDPARAPRAVLTEGAQDRWTPAAARTFATKGGARVLFACGQVGCVGMAKQAVARLEKAGVASRVVLGAGVGHGYGGVVAGRIAGALEWLVEGDRRWALEHVDAPH